MNGEFDAMFKMVAELVSRKRDRDLREYNLTFSQMRVLLAVGEEESGIAQKELEQRLDISHAAVHALLMRLVEKELIEVQMDPLDRRRNVILLTPAGKKKIHVLQQEYRPTPPTSLLSDKDRDDLSRVLKKLISYLQEEERVYRERMNGKEA